MIMPVPNHPDQSADARDPKMRAATDTVDAAVRTIEASVVRNPAVTLAAAAAAGVFLGWIVKRT